MLSFEKYTFIFVAINLIILYWFLRKFLFKPVTEFMEKRASSIKESLDNAEKGKHQARDLRAKYEEQLKALKQEREKVLKEAMDKAAVEYGALIANARADAEGILQKARDEVAKEREQMLKEVRNQAASLALAVASKILERNIDNDSNRKLAEEFINEEGAA